VKTSRIGRIVAGSLCAGLLVAPALVIAGPIAGREEHVVTGTILLAFASGWALLALLSRRAGQPQWWSLGPAAFLGAAGAALVTFAPSSSTLDALGWIWPPALLAVVVAVVIRVRRTLQSRARTVVVYPVLLGYALCAAGGGYETAREFFKRRMHAAPGQLIDVGGRRLHVQCAGSGSPTVVLESGLGETGAYWRWIQAELAADTRVCTYDRAGRGWSDAAAGPQDGIAVAADLHTLLERARIRGPFVLVGHSSGAQYVRIFAGQHPADVAGIVLLDGQPAEAFEGLPTFPAFYRVFRRVSPILPSLARVGAGRLLLDDEHASAAGFRSMRDEFAELPASLAEARSARSFGNLPLVVLTAARDAMAGWLPLQDSLAALSSNSSHRVVPFTHNGLVVDPAAARVSSQSIRDVVHAARSGSRL